MTGFLVLSFDSVTTFSESPVYLPVSAHVVVKDNAKIKAGDILIKIPRAVGKSGGDITGGLPRDRGTR